MSRTIYDIGINHDLIFIMFVKAKVDRIFEIVLNCLFAASCQLGENKCKWRILFYKKQKRMEIIFLKWPFTFLFSVYLAGLE